MNLKELEKKAYNMMLLNPNSEQYRQIKAYINQIKEKEFLEKLENQSNEILDNSDIEDDYPNDEEFFGQNEDGVFYGSD
jgi:hypothetical protein